MVFAKFFSRNYPHGGGGVHYFVGRDRAAILRDTNGGKRFGSAFFSSYTWVEEEKDFFSLLKKEQ